VRRLEEDGVITGYIAVIDQDSIGRGFEVIIHADLAAKDLATVEAFEDRVAAMSEVAELRRMFGIPDYVIRVQVADLAAYEHQDRPWRTAFQRTLTAMTYLTRRGTGSYYSAVYRDSSVEKQAGCVASAAIARQARHRPPRTTPSRRPVAHHRPP
jgi:DNA-binding Lrp family transcriptional regulator